MSIKVPMAAQWPRIRGGGGVLARAANWSGRRY